MAKKAADKESNYTVAIDESSRELTFREVVKFEDTGDAIKLDKATQDGEIIITPIDFVVLKIHNDLAEDTDYKNFLIIDADGTKYVTGSNSFYKSFRQIFDVMNGKEAGWQLKVYQKPSKNYSDKNFITCSLV